MKQLNNIKASLIMVFMLGICFLGEAQQIAHTSIFEGTKAYWNPAAIGLTPHFKTDVWLRQQWLGFGSTAPRTGYIGAEYPFLDMNMTAGGMITFDQTGPVSKTGLQVNYAYQLKGVLTEEAILSLGIKAGGQQYAFGKDDVVFNDAGDVLLQADKTSTIFPTVGAGVFFKSSTEEWYQNVFFAGLAYHQLYSTDVLVNGFNQKRQSHIFLNLGSRIYSPDSYVEPSLIVNYTNPEIVDFIATVKYEMRNTFWMGFGYSSVSDISLEGGYILNDFGSRDSQLRLGIIGHMGVSEGASSFGPGAEIYVAYLFDMDRGW